MSLEKNNYPIRTVAALTGIHPVTLRTWERRYNLIEPIRTPKGHRLYTKEQIALLHRVVDLLDKGVPISRINFSMIAEGSDSFGAHEEEFWQRLINRMTKAVGMFDEVVLENTYNEALALYSIQTVTDKLLMPMLVKLGERWEKGEGTVAEEHFFGVYLRNKLGARFHHRKRRDHGSALLTACMPGERHEAGVLLFALSAYDHGYRCILLGSDMPMEELPAAVLQSKSRAIVLSASFVSDAAWLHEKLHRLVQATHVPVFVGGVTSVTLHDTITEAGAVPLGSDIERSFVRIAETFKQRFSLSLKGAKQAG